MSAALRLLGAQVWHELTRLRRTPVVMVMSVGFPVVFFVLLAALVGNETLDSRQGIRMAQFLAPGMASFGVVMSTFSFLAVGFAEARSTGILKRAAGTPLPTWALLGGRIGAATALGLTSAALVLGVGVAGYHVQLFWRTAAAVVVALLLGSLCFAALGLLLAALAPSQQATLAIANGLVIPLSFISDVFMTGTGMPDWMTRLGWFFPLKHMAVLVGDALNPYLGGNGFQADHLAALVGFTVAGGLAAAWALRRDTDAVARTRSVRSRPGDRVARTGAPTVASLVLGQVRHTQTALRRDAGSVFFAVIFPVLLVAVIPAVNGGGDQLMEDGRSLGSLFAATMAVYGAAVTAYVFMPANLAEARDTLVLKRLRGTPLPAWVLLVGRVAGVVVIALATLVLSYAVAMALYGVGVPPRWPLALAVLVFGVVCLAVVGLAVMSLVRSAQSAIGLALGTLLPAAFVSDIFVIGVTMPPVVDAIAGALPLRPLVRSVVAATAPTPQPLEMGQLLVMVAWLVAGAAVVAWRFRWEPRQIAARARRVRPVRAS